MLVSEADRAATTYLTVAGVFIPLERDTRDIVFILGAGIGLGGEIELVCEYQIEGTVAEIARGFVGRCALEARERLEIFVLHRGASVVTLIVYDLPVRVRACAKP